MCLWNPIGPDTLWGSVVLNVCCDYTNEKQCSSSHFLFNQCVIMDMTANRIFMRVSLWGLESTLNLPSYAVYKYVFSQGQKFKGTNFGTFSQNRLILLKPNFDGKTSRNKMIPALVSKFEYRGAFLNISIPVINFEIWDYWHQFSAASNSYCREKVNTWKVSYHNAGPLVENDNFFTILSGDMGTPVLLPICVMKILRTFAKSQNFQINHEK